MLKKQMTSLFKSEQSTSEYCNEPEYTTTIVKHKHLETKNNTYILP